MFVPDSRIVGYSGLFRRLLIKIVNRLLHFLSPSGSTGHMLAPLGRAGIERCQIEPTTEPLNGLIEPFAWAFARADLS
jgi:hypothetical protein